MIEDELIARVVWRDITFLKNHHILEDENLEEYLIRFETFGRIKEKDGVVMVTMETPIADESEKFNTANGPAIQLIPIGVVEKIEILESTKKKNTRTRRRS